MIFSTESPTSSLLLSLFSTARTTPVGQVMPTAVEPSLIASIAYSTWKRRPSGENVDTPRSYSDLRRWRGGEGRRRGKRGETMEC